MTTSTDLPTFLLGPDFGPRLADLESLAVLADDLTTKKEQKDD